MAIKAVCVVSFESDKKVEQPVVQIKPSQHQPAPKQVTKRGIIQDGTKPIEDRIGVEDGPGGPQPSVGSSDELQRTLSNEEGKLGDLGAGKLGSRSLPGLDNIFLWWCSFVN